mmetsp:Transcript_47632/g.96119  ORF Transcript_47632/g.96119 Transcript_47632/m.96119 type:complete len:164 (-) Transcript_47632:97-588(-)
MVLDEVALVTGSADLTADDRIPFGCTAEGADKVMMDHRPVEEDVATAARSLYYLRRSAEDLAHWEKAPRNIRNYAGDVAKYAHDLEFFTRQLGLGLKMPIMVEPPYLPIDIAAMPVALSLWAPPLAKRGYGSGLRCRHAVALHPGERSKWRGMTTSGRGGHFL